MKRVTFEINVDIDDSATALGALDSIKGALSFLSDEGHNMDEDFTQYNIVDIVMVDIENMDNPNIDKPPNIAFVSGPISWEDAAKIATEYELVLAREEKDEHELYVDEHDTLRWVKKPEREKEIMALYNAKDMNELFMNGADKNDPIIRELYKCIGYSLFGFWEVFYWEANNECANEYIAPIREQ